MGVELKFDEIEIDTLSAEKYVIGEKTLSKLLKSDEIDTIYYNGDTFTQELPKTTDNKSTQGLNLKLRQLAGKIKENINLFAQLDYLYRNIPIKDTVDQVHVVVQQITYLANNLKIEESIYGSGRFKWIPLFSMTADTPILLFGAIARVLFCSKGVCIDSDKTTAAISYLFTRICHEIDLSVIVKFADRVEIKSYFNKGAIGVVSELSDVDSAAHEFAMSSLTAPWRLERILVQESVFEQFLDALKWKCDLNKQGNAGGNGDVPDSLQYAGRTFMINNLTSENPQSSQVYVSAYRTRKELLSLLNEHQPHYLSLWANDVAEINEIAHNVHSPVVWLNNYADFRGPPAVSEAIYSHFIWSSSEQQVKELSDRKKSWIQLDFETRRDILCKSLESYAPIDPKSKILCNQLKENLQSYDMANFVYVRKDYVCYSISVPKCFSLDLTEFIAQCENVLQVPPNILIKIFQSVLIGNAFALTRAKPVSSISDHLDELFKKTGIPIVHLEYSQEESPHTKIEGNVFSSLSYVTTKVIWTNSGTIFAN